MESCISSWRMMVSEIFTAEPPATAETRAAVG
jgi:hypothetical protein